MTLTNIPTADNGPKSGRISENIPKNLQITNGYQCPYPCIKMYRFMDISIATLPIYPEILDRTKNGDNFLDPGCCLGQEIRQLVFDGTPSKNTYGSDLYGGCFPVGYKLFKDQDRLQTTFIAADIFDNTSKLTELEGKINIIYTGAFFHLFGLEEQKKIAAKLFSCWRHGRGRWFADSSQGMRSQGSMGGKAIRVEESLFGIIHKVGKSCGTMLVR